MEYFHLNSALLTLISIAFGGLLGALGSRLTQEHNSWIWGFYIIGLIPMVVPIFLVIQFWDTINGTDLTLVVSSIVAGAFLIYYSYRHISAKNIFKTEELHPIINKHTETADKRLIRLFGGDLDFFGKYPIDMDKNSQYVTLKNAGFKRIEIICEDPSQIDKPSKIRYGKVLSDLPNVRLKFYHPKKADLKVRGRIIEISGVSKLVMFEKLEPKKYKAIQTDTGNSTGVLYQNIWDLVWSLATKTTEEQLSELKMAFTEHSS